MQLFLRSAARVDPVGIEQSLDQGFALGSFEHVVDSCLFPTLEAIGEGWLRREIDIVTELAFATAIRRKGLDLLYLGADVPATSWHAAVTTRSAGPRCSPW